jgi:para-aminobenzoate synthetase component 1
VGRWSFASARPSRVVRGDDLADPFGPVAALAADGPDAPPAPRVVGFFGYECNRAVERLPAPRPRATPDVWFGIYDAVWRSDGATAEVVGTSRAACEELLDALRRPAPATTAPLFGPLLPEEDAGVYLAGVRRVLAYVRAGDVYQVNLSRRLAAPLLADGDPLALHQRLAPAPYGAVLELGDATVIANTPELFLRRAGDRVETRPIKGTRARGAGAAHDARLRAELAADAKERAEHLMIVDLLRNDLGRVAEIGSVRVDGFARVVSLPTVHHLVSTVSCRPRGSVADLLRATFPGGSITGAPKVRAMQIIDELEPSARGVYTGALGWLGAGGTLDLAIAIRTATLAGGRLTLSVGGGVVADSTPERELEETEEKAAAWRRALAP